jgi:L-malate glycosyltransferase
VIPNFVDTEVWRPNREPCHRSKLAPEGHKIIMHVSNFRPVKRTLDVVDVFAALRKEVPARLVLVGDGPDRPRALQHAADLGLRDEVLFLGKHATVEELLSCADLFLLPSSSESFGLAALEAMACGTPVVATTAGGIPEVVRDGETGFLLPVGDIEQMTQASVRILTDKALAKSMSQAARALTQECFSTDVVVPRYEALYDRVLGRA